MRMQNRLKLIVFIGVLLLIVGDVAAQKGKIFPAISGEDHKDKVITIPNDTNGKITLIGMAYSKKSEDDLKTWFNPVYQTFIDKPKNPSPFDEPLPEMNVYFLPMFTGVNQAAAGTAKKKMVQSLDKSLLPHVIFYKGELAKYKDELDFEKKDIPYFFLLDKEGKIIHALSGAYSKDKLYTILDLLEDL